MGKEEKLLDIGIETLFEYGWSDNKIAEHLGLSVKAVSLLRIVCEIA